MAKQQACRTLRSFGVLCFGPTWRRTYQTHEEARQDVLDYIEMSSARRTPKTRCRLGCSMREAFDFWLPVPSMMVLGNIEYSQACRFSPRRRFHAPLIGPHQSVVHEVLGTGCHCLAAGPRAPMIAVLFQNQPQHCGRTGEHHDQIKPIDPGHPFHGIPHLWQEMSEPPDCVVRAADEPSA